MKTIQSKNIKFMIALMAITVSGVFCNSANAQRHKIHEIGWSSRLSSMGLNKPKNLGEQYTFYCQPSSEDLIYAPIWGTDNYTPNSGICTTAVHAGMIEAKTGGEVTIELIEGQDFYTGSRKHDVTSQDHRQTKISFIFIGEKIAREQTEKDSVSRRSSGIERVMVKGVERGVERTIEKVITEIFK